MEVTLLTSDLSCGINNCQAIHDIASVATSIWHCQTAELKERLFEGVSSSNEIPLIDCNKRWVAESDSIEAPTDLHATLANAQAG